MLSMSKFKQINSTNLVVLLATLLVPPTAEADLVWDDHFTDEQEITNGFVLTTSDNVITTTVGITEDNAGDFSPFSSANIFSYEGNDQQGNQTQYAEMSFLQASDDPNDFLTFRLDFSSPVTDLSFSMLDIDQGPPSGLGLLGPPTFVDLVEVFVNDINVTTDPTWYTVGSSNQLDDEAAADGFEGSDEADPDTTDGNVSFDFGVLDVNSLEITYRSSDDATGNPSGQTAGVSNLSFNTVSVPEPSMFPVMLLSAGLFARRRRS